MNPEVSIADFSENLLGSKENEQLNSEERLSHQFSIVSVIPRLIFFYGPLLSLFEMNWLLKLICYVLIAITDYYWVKRAFRQLPLFVTQMRVYTDPINRFWGYQNQG